MRSNEAINPGTATDIDDTPAVFAGKGGRDIYIAHVLFTLNQWNYLISHLTDSGDLRIVPCARSAVSTIKDHDLKIMLLKALSADIEKVRSWSEKTLLEKNQKIIEVCQNAINIVYDSLLESIKDEAKVILPMCEDPPKEDIGDADCLLSKTEDL